MPEVMQSIQLGSTPLRVCATGVASARRCGNVIGANPGYNHIYARFPSDHGDYSGPVGRMVYAAGQGCGNTPLEAQ